MKRTEIDKGVFVELFKNIKTGQYTGMLTFNTPNIPGRTFIKTRQYIKNDGIVKGGKLVYVHHYIKRIKIVVEEDENL